MINHASINIDQSSCQVAICLFLHLFCDGSEQRACAFVSASTRTCTEAKYHIISQTYNAGRLSHMSYSYSYVRGPTLKRPPPFHSVWWSWLHYATPEKLCYGPRAASFRSKSVRTLDGAPQTRTSITQVTSRSQGREVQVM
jgi:hypothetical protein